MVTLRLVLNTRMNGYPETSSKYKNEWLPYIQGWMATLKLVLNTRMNGYPETSSKYRDEWLPWD